MISKPCFPRAGGAPQPKGAKDPHCAQEHTHTHTQKKGSKGPEGPTLIDTLGTNQNAPRKPPPSEATTRFSTVITYAEPSEPLRHTVHAPPPQPLQSYDIPPNTTCFKYRFVFPTLMILLVLYRPRESSSSSLLPTASPCDRSNHPHRAGTCAHRPGPRSADPRPPSRDTS